MNNLKLYRPLVSKRVSQAFGENRACVTSNGLIVGTRTTCPLNTRPFYPTIGMEGHNGIDFPAIVGEPVYHCAMYDGWLHTEVDRSGGIGVDIVSNAPVRLHDGREVYLKTRYWHLKAPVGHEGKQVKFGQVIGLAGNTGASSAAHLHFGIKVCDKNGVALEKGNGYYGAFNPEPYMNFDTDAKVAAEMLTTPAPELTNQERKDMLAQLNVLQIMLIELLAFIKRM